MNDDLPELTADERSAMNDLPPDLVARLIRGERPLTCPICGGTRRHVPAEGRFRCPKCEREPHVN